MRRLTLMTLIVVLAVGCGTTRTQTVYERVEVPVPVWTPPEGIRPLPPEPTLLSPTLDPDSTPSADIVRALLRDLLTVLGDLLETRHLYSELVRLCEHPDPAEHHDSDGSGGG